MKLKTYQLELLAVAAILLTVTVFTKNSLIEYVGSLAVLLSFGHAQISERLAEREAIRNILNKLKEKDHTELIKRDKLSVECYHKLLYYFIGKELCWCVYFLTTKSYAALVGVFVFLLYPLWRKWWRRVKPIS